MTLVVDKMRWNTYLIQLWLRKLSLLLYMSDDFFFFLLLLSVRFNIFNLKIKTYTQCVLIGSVVVRMRVSLALEFSEFLHNIS